MVACVLPCVCSESDGIYVVKLPYGQVGSTHCLCFPCVVFVCVVLCVTEPLSLLALMGAMSSF